MSKCDRYLEQDLKGNKLDVNDYFQHFSKVKFFILCQNKFINSCITEYECIELTALHMYKIIILSSLILNEINDPFLKQGLRV